MALRELVFDDKAEAEKFGAPRLANGSLRVVQHRLTPFRCFTIPLNEQAQIRRSAALRLLANQQQLGILKLQWMCFGIFCTGKTFSFQRSGSDVNSATTALGLR